MRGLKAGTTVTAIIGDVSADAKVEGVVPSGPNLYTVNALVPNPKGLVPQRQFRHAGAPARDAPAILVPNGAVVRQGDLTGVRAVADGQPTLRWVKLGRTADGMTEVLSGLAAGDTVVVAGGER